ncbi:hypothetical protein [Dactylosporangium darangshiense]|uniref:SHOCT domain-containing protein n=1 Tax=Dactylosporangium darangshiense TaxID=579108 RepID=A0ABP8DUS7_9ACTN
MVFTIFVIVLAAVAVVSSASAWFARHRSRDETGPQPAVQRPTDPAVIAEAISRADSHGERVEAVLTTWLLAGHLSAEEYRRDMAILAEREALRHGRCSGR